MSLCTSCSEETDFISILSSSGTQVCYGKQIQHMFFQSMAGSSFDGASVSGTPATDGGDIEEETDWTAKYGADPTDTNKIIAIRNLSGAAIAEPTNQELSGNDVPGGGIIVTGQTYSLTFRLIYLNKAQLIAFSKVSCWPKFRFWFQDNQGYLWTGSNDSGAAAGVSVGIINATIANRGVSYPGEGQAVPVNAQATISWTDQQPIPVADTVIDFLDTVIV